MACKASIAHHASLGSYTGTMDRRYQICDASCGLATATRHAGRQAVSGNVLCGSEQKGRHPFWNGGLQPVSCQAFLFASEQVLDEADLVGPEADLSFLLREVEVYIGEDAEVVVAFGVAEYLMGLPDVVGLLLVL